MNIQILFFNLARDAAGEAAAELPCSGPMTQEAFWNALVERYPGLGKLPGIRAPGQKQHVRPSRTKPSNRATKLP